MACTFTEKYPFLFLYSSEFCPPGQRILIWVQSIVPITPGRPPIWENLYLASGVSLGIEKWMNIWWWAAMALATLPTIRLTDDCEICSKSPTMLWKLPVAKNRKLANSCSIGGMLDALPENVLKSSLIMSKNTSYCVLRKPESGLELIVLKMPQRIWSIP